MNTTAINVTYTPEDDKYEIKLNGSQRQFIAHKHRDGIRIQEMQPTGVVYKAPNYFENIPEPTRCKYQTNPEKYWEAANNFKREEGFSPCSTGTPGITVTNIEEVKNQVALAITKNEWLGAIDENSQMETVNQIAKELQKIYESIVTATEEWSSKIQTATGQETTGKTTDVAKVVLERATQQITRDALQILNQGAQKELDERFIDSALGTHRTIDRLLAWNGNQILRHRKTTFGNWKTHNRTIAKELAQRHWKTEEQAIKMHGSLFRENYSDPTKLQQGIHNYRILNELRKLIQATKACVYECDVENVKATIPLEIQDMLDKADNGELTRKDALKLRKIDDPVITGFRYYADGYVRLFVTPDAAKKLDGK